MAHEIAGIEPEVLQMQQEAERRVRRMREQNRRLAQEMGARPPEHRMVRPTTPPRIDMDSGRLLPLVLAYIIYREHGPTELVLALLYLAL